MQQCNSRKVGTPLTAVVFTTKKEMLSLARIAPLISFFDSSSCLMVGLNTFEFPAGLRLSFKMNARFSFSVEAGAIRISLAVWDCA